MKVARPTTQNQETDLWRWVDRRGPAECWPWTGHVTQSGYGRLRVRTKQIMAHRVAYLLGHGSDPGDLLVCHRCDNPPCCNPAHLFLGTVQDNALDARDKGRLVFPRGSQHGRAKLDENKVVAIRARRAQGTDPTVLADEYGVARDTIRNIVKRRTWRHVA